MLTATGLGCERDGRVLFAGLDFSLAGGEICELRGANGAGKSTLLRVLAGLYTDYVGEVRSEPGDHGLLYLGHRPGVAALLTADENLAWQGSLKDGEHRPREARLEALAQVGLAGFGDVRAVAMSAGQQRRVALARLLLTRARLWLLDEPLTALDADGAALVGTLLDAHRAAGGAALVATHADLPLADCRRLTLGVRRPAAGN